MTTKEIC